MNLRILLARRISKRLEREARLYRRALRDHLRHETSRIRKLEIRSRVASLRGWSAAASKVNWIRPRIGTKQSRRIPEIAAHPPLLNARSTDCNNTASTPTPNFAQIREALRGAS
jgi:hypothetical protein